MLIFINEILVYYKDKKDHKVHQRLMLEKLRQYKLKEKFLKCHFCKRHVKFLRHIVLENGLAMHQPKIETINGWKRLETVTEIRSLF